ncbi:MAG TPA: NUDIX hydrolase [Xanthobacteraceae bacterium]|jgi:nudix-type nucleoside diphosphatase (YffH/AdpP family)|nr:NUDIX hydrolase [Xanthobacteraceae bacterium]
MTKIIKTETKFEGYSRLLIATVELPDGQTIRREIEDHGRAVCVLPYDPARRTAILVRQFRAPAALADGRENLLEAVAGSVEDETPDACAYREALEEAGLKLHALEHLGTAWSMPGISTEQMDLYLAAYSEADRVGVGGGLADEHEGITVVELPLAELAAMADAGQIMDMKTLAVVQTLRLRKPELFE